MNTPPEPKLLPKVYYSNEYMTRVIMDEDFEKWNTRPTPNAASCLECETIGQSACPEHGLAEEIIGNLNKKNGHRPECQCAACINPNAASGEVDDVRIDEIAAQYAKRFKAGYHEDVLIPAFKQAILEATKDLLAQIASKDRMLKLAACDYEYEEGEGTGQAMMREGIANALTNSPAAAKELLERYSLIIHFLNEFKAKAPVMAQLFDAFRNEDSSWSEHDKQVRQNLTEFMIQCEVLLVKEALSTTQPAKVPDCPKYMCVKCHTAQLGNPASELNGDKICFDCYEPKTIQELLNQQRPVKEQP